MFYRLQRMISVACLTGVGGLREISGDFTVTSVELHVDECLERAQSVAEKLAKERSLWKTIQNAFASKPEPIPWTCALLGCMDLAAGYHGKVCKCSEDTICKLAEQSTLAELVDEFQSMRKLADVGIPCIPKLLQTRLPDEVYPILQMEFINGITVEQWGRGNHDPLSIDTHHTEQIHDAIKAAAFVTCGHDRVSGNFLIPSGDAPCPVYFIDLPEKTYFRNIVTSPKSPWVRSCNVARALLPDLNCSDIPTQKSQAVKWSPKGSVVVRDKTLWQQHCMSMNRAFPKLDCKNLPTWHRCSR